jgi:hypothetical protein
MIKWFTASMLTRCQSCYDGHRRHERRHGLQHHRVRHGHGRGRHRALRFQWVLLSVSKRCERERGCTNRLSHGHGSCQRRRHDPGKLFLVSTALQLRFLANAWSIGLPARNDVPFSFALAVCLVRVWVPSFAGAGLGASRPSRLPCLMTGFSMALVGGCWDSGLSGSSSGSLPAGW